MIDSDADPELVDFFTKLGFGAKFATRIRCPNIDWRLLHWATERGYVFVCHDKHKDPKTKFEFYRELHKNGGKVIRVGGEPGQDPLIALGKILVNMPKWRAFFAESSGEVVVHETGCTEKAASSFLDDAGFRRAALNLGRTTAPLPKKRPKRPPPGPRLL